MPHRSWKYYLISTSTVMVPSVVGLWWSRRDHLMCALLPSFIRRNGNTTFAQNGIVLERSRKAGVEGAAMISCSRILMSVANVTVPLALVSLFEKKNMVFFTPLKGILFTGTGLSLSSGVEFAIICSCLLTPALMGLINPIGRITEDVPYYVENEEDKDAPAEISVKREDVLYFRGYFRVYYEIQFVASPLLFKPQRKKWRAYSDPR